MLVNRLPQIMAQEEVSIRQLARLTGVTYTTIRAMVHGQRRSIQLDVLDAVCEALGVQPGDIYRRLASGRREASGLGKASGRRQALGQQRPAREDSGQEQLDGVKRVLEGEFTPSTPTEPQSSFRGRPVTSSRQSEWRTW